MKSYLKSLPRNKNNDLKNVKHGILLKFLKSELKRNDVEEISKIWQDKLFYGRIHVQNYVIEDDTILVTLQYGWEGRELKDFLLDQEHVKSVTWDSKEYTQKPKKKRKKKRRKKREGL